MIEAITLNMEKNLLFTQVLAFLRVCCKKIKCDKKINNINFKRT